MFIKHMKRSRFLSSGISVFSCPIHRIDHHYGHTLSLWALGVEPTIHFVFDGFGDDWMYRSVWRDDTLVDYGKTSINPNQMYDGDMSPSFGFITD